MKCRTVVFVVVFVFLLALTVTFITPHDYPMLYGVFLLVYVGRILWEKCICYMSGALLPNILEPTKVIIVNDDKTCEKVINQILLKIKNYQVIGFECEWQSNLPKRPIALLQLATSDGLCVLIRIYKFCRIPINLLIGTDELRDCSWIIQNCKRCIPVASFCCVKEFLKNRSIIKVGSTVTSSARRLWNDYGLRVSGCLDVDRASSFDNYSMERIAQIVLGLKLAKPKTIDCSNWAAYELSDTQVKYAASKAFVPLKILEKRIKQKMNKVNVRERDAQEQFRYRWKHLIDQDVKTSTCCII